MGRDAQVSTAHVQRTVAAALRVTLPSVPRETQDEHSITNAACWPDGTLGGTTPSDDARSRACRAGSKYAEWKARSMSDRANGEGKRLGPLGTNWSSFEHAVDSREANPSEPSNLLRGSGNRRKQSAIARQSANHCALILFFTRLLIGSTYDVGNKFSGVT